MRILFYLKSKISVWIRGLGRVLETAHEYVWFNLVDLKDMYRTWGIKMCLNIHFFRVFFSLAHLGPPLIAPPFTYADYLDRLILSGQI